MKKVLLGLLVASALSADIWECSNLGAKDDSYELGYNSNDINSTITIRNGILALKAGEADIRSYTKYNTSLDGFTSYENKKTKDMITTNRYMDNKRLFVITSMDTTYMISDCRLVK